MSDLEQLNNSITGEWQDLRTSFSCQNKESGTKYNVSTEIPQLQKLIEAHPNKEQLEEEIKNLAMKFYWDGFYNGKPCQDR